MEPDEQAIRQLHSTFIDAVNAADVDRLLGLMTDDVVLLSPGREPVGREGFGPVHSGAHAQSRIRCTSELEEVVVVGDVAYTRSRDALSVTPRATSTRSGQAGGDETRLAGHRLTVYRKHPDGRWLLARDAHTLTPVSG